MHTFKNNRQLKENMHRFISAKQIAIVAVFIQLLFVAKAQQLPQYSNYMLNSFAMNPAIAGSNNYFEGISTNRYQWVGLTDAPRTYMLTAHGPLKAENMGLGGYLYTDIVGPTRRIGISGTYAYHLKLSEKVKMSLGLSAGIVQFAIDASKIALRDPADLVLTNSLQSVIAPDFGAGTYVYSVDKKWYVGLSVPQVLQSKINFVEVSTATVSNMARHYYLLAGYKYKLNEQFALEPSTCVKYASPAPVQFDLGLRAIYKDKMWLGGVYRHLDAASVLVGYNLKENMTFAYSYDFTTSNIRNHSNGTHELLIGIKFHKPAVRSASSTVTNPTTP
jgi:type IX secretion system PorP/SprF family membrane protein